MKLTGWVDAHCHLTDKRISEDLPAILARAESHQVKHFLLGGVDPDEWQQQEKLCTAHPGQIWPSFGLHPYFIAKSQPSEIDAALGLLEKKVPKALALGEMGLDFRSHIAGNERPKQIAAFKSQLELAKKLDKPVVLHIVRAHDEALSLFKKMSVTKIKGLVHAFNGSWRVAEKYLQHGLFLSIGGALLHENNRGLQEVVRQMPIEHLLVESDAPDQAPPSIAPKNNEPWTITLVASQIAQLRGMQAREILAQTQDNFTRLFTARN